MRRESIQISFSRLHCDAKILLYARYDNATGCLNIRLHIVVILKAYLEIMFNGIAGKQK
jgi:hypothetical protein